jgi:hypothetical protein
LAIIDVIAQIDAEIAKLQQAKTLLGGLPTPTPTPTPAPAVAVAVAVKSGRRGRPKGSKNAAKAVAVAPAKTAGKPKRKLSPEGRKAIAEAMKRRWAEHRKVTTK